MPKLSLEQSLLLFVISHQYVLINNEGDLEDDVKKAIIGTFAASKIEYKLSKLIEDITYLQQYLFIEKNIKDKRYDLTAITKGNPALILYDEKKSPAPKFPPLYEDFIKTFWVLFCSFLKNPLIELLKEIGSSESKNFNDLNTGSDIAVGTLCDLAIKRGLVSKDIKEGTVSLTESGRSMIPEQK